MQMTERRLLRLPSSSLPLPSTTAGMSDIGHCVVACVSRRAMALPALPFHANVWRSEDAETETARVRVFTAVGRRGRMASVQHG